MYVGCWTWETTAVWAGILWICLTVWTGGWIVFIGTTGGLAITWLCFIGAGKVTGFTGLYDWTLGIGAGIVATGTGTGTLLTCPGLLVFIPGL